MVKKAVPRYIPSNTPRAFKGGFGIGKRMIARPHVAVGITSNTIQRIARRGGVFRMSDDVYNKARDILVAFIKRIAKNAIIFASSAGRKTLQKEDFLRALRYEVRMCVLLYICVCFDVGLRLTYTSHMRVCLIQGMHMYV